jgi:hypothetical protein
MVFVVDYSSTSMEKTSDQNYLDLDGQVTGRKF